MTIATCTKLAFLLPAIVCFGGNAAFATESPSVEIKRFIPNTSARFELVLGRLQLSSEFFRIGSAHDRSKLANGNERTRSISISTQRGKPTMQFRDNGGEEEVYLSFKADQNVDIVHTIGSGSDCYKLSYHQPHLGPITLRIEFRDGREAIELVSNSLWHLAINETQIFETYMQPCLSRLEPSWQISRTVAAARALTISPLTQSGYEEVERLIVQLDAQGSAERASAMTRLESMGIAVEHQLRHSLTTDLSSQQETSVNRLLNTIQPMGNDTPMRVAVWLASELSESK